MIAVISAISVDSTSWVRQLFCCKSIESRILLATPIIRSHEPPMWEACGGLKFQLHPCLLRYLCTVLSISNSLLAPMKLVPQSDWSCLAGPLRAKKRLRAFIQLDASIDSISSMFFCLCLSSSGASGYNGPRPKDIKPDMCEGRTDLETFRRQVSHTLFFQSPTQLSADYAFVED